MRIRIVRGKAASSGELRVNPGSHEQLNLAQVRWLSARSDPVVLPFALKHAKGLSRRKVRLCYQLGSRTSLGAYLKGRVLDAAQLSCMLDDLVCVLELVAQAPRGTPMALFDKRYVFVDGAGHLSFALVPLGGVAWDEGDSPLALLRLLADTRKVAFGSAGDVACAERLQGFVEREGKAFSLNRFRSFVEGEFGRKKGAARAYRPAPLSAKGDAGGVAVLCDLSRGATYALEAGQTYWLGRGEGCDVCLAQHPLVSRRHASVRCEREGVMLTDQGSTNGSFVAGRRIAAGQGTFVPFGQEFRLASARLRTERRTGGTGD
ncbi:MAG: FHA domain-containing protein [Coriobacteriales bacterium]|nr:FHA domain-containing protein [Coriobacteriales bacterium]